jgi:hypothetical protein
MWRKKVSLTLCLECNERHVADPSRAIAGRKLSQLPGSNAAARKA